MRKGEKTVKDILFHPLLWAAELNSIGSIRFLGPHLTLSYLGFFPKAESETRICGEVFYFGVNPGCRTEGPKRKTEGKRKPPHKGVLLRSPLRVISASFSLEASKKHIDHLPELSTRD